MRTYKQPKRWIPLASSLLGASLLSRTCGHPWERLAYADPLQSPFVEPPAMLSDPPAPPSMDTQTPTDPGAAAEGVLAQVQQMVDALARACRPPTQSDPSRADTSDRAQSCNVVIARNVESPGAAAVANQSQEAPVTQTPGLIDAADATPAT